MVPSQLNSRKRGSFIQCWLIKPQVHSSVRIGSGEISQDPSPSTAHLQKVASLAYVWSLTGVNSVNVPTLHIAQPKRSYMILSSIISRYGLSSVVPKKMRDIYQPLLTHVWWLKPCQPPILLVNLPIQSVSGSFTTANSSPKPPGDGKSRACATRATREPTREISWIGMEAVARLAVRKTHETCRLRLSSRNRFPFW
jgi:hypothetical protein